MKLGLDEDFFTVFSDGSPENIFLFSEGEYYEAHQFSVSINKNHKRFSIGGLYGTNKKLSKEFLDLPEFQLIFSFNRRLKGSITSLEAYVKGKKIDNLWELEFKKDESGVTFETKHMDLLGNNPNCIVNKWM